MNEAGVPDFKDELNRKTLLTIEKIMRWHDQDEYSSEEAVAALRAVFDVASGLAKDSVISLLVEAIESYEGRNTGS